MKLRINQNSVRLRLTPEEVDTLTSEGTIVSSCLLLNASLEYVLQTADQWSAEISGSRIKISIPETEVRGWHENDKVGFEHHFENGLLLLIEKDFQCLHPRQHENEDHLYPNPEQA